MTHTNQYRDKGQTLNTNYQADGTTEIIAGGVTDRDTFIAVYTDVWMLLRGRGELHTYMALKARTTMTRSGMFGTRKQLAAEAGVSVNTFDTHVRSLEKMGLIERVARFVPADWAGDPDEIRFTRDETYCRQIGSRYVVMFHVPENGGDGDRGTAAGGEQDTQTGEPSHTRKVSRGGTQRQGMGCPPKVGNRVDPLEKIPGGGGVASRGDVTDGPVAASSPEPSLARSGVVVSVDEPGLPPRPSEPPRFCADHRDGNNGRPCQGCGRARERHAEWERHVSEWNRLRDQVSLRREAMRRWPRPRLNHH